MKTFFIKDDETKTAEDYLSKYDIDSKKNAYDYVSATGKKYIDMVSKINDIHYYLDGYNEESNLFNPLSDDAGAGRYIAFAIDDAERDGNKKAVQDIKNIANKIGFVTRLLNLRKKLNNATTALNEYKSSVDNAIQKFKSFGITK